MNTHISLFEKISNHVEIHELSTRFIYFEVDGSMPRIKGTSI